MNREHFITPDALEKRLGNDNLSIVCNFMYLPGQNLDGRDEYNEDRIPGTVYFDLDEIAVQNTTLPHMLASPEQFSKQMGALGISDTDEIVIYDGPGIYSSPRIWYNFHIMGAKNVRILEGGYDRWIVEDREIDENPPAKINPKAFNAEFDASRIVDEKTMLALIKEKRGTILDARSLERYTGEVDEPREGLILGHMPGAISFPFANLVEKGTLIDNAKLRDLIAPLLSNGEPIITTCGSGVTAATLSLALTCAGYSTHAMFDGSWTQWGDPGQDYPIISGA